jgi:thiamine pyrophosphokinase
MATHGAPRHILVVADGDVAPRAELDAAWPGWADDAAAVVAADGGFARAVGLGLKPDVLIGDLDSLTPEGVAEAEASGARVIRHRTDKDESDAELALLEAIGMGAAKITVLGAFGGPRLDHALANLWLLAHPALAHIDLVLLDAGARARLLTAPGPDGATTPGPDGATAPGPLGAPGSSRAPVTQQLPGRLGAIISLLPFGGDAEGVTTHGLRYPLRDEPLRIGPARGLSNVRVALHAAVDLRQGRLLIVERPS